MVFKVNGCIIKAEKVLEGFPYTFSGKFSLLVASTEKWGQQKALSHRELISENKFQWFSKWMSAQYSQKMYHKRSNTFTMYMVGNLLSWILLHLTTDWSFHGVLGGATSWCHQWWHAWWRHSRIDSDSDSDKIYFQNK